MNIQIFGTKKCNNTKKAQRFFKERGIKIQFIDLREREMSRGELQSVISAVGGIESLLDDGARDRDSLALIRHLLPEAQLDRFLMKITMDYPSLEEEVDILERHHTNTSLIRLDDIKPAITKEELLSLRAFMNQVFVDRTLLQYIALIVQQTRTSKAVYLGASPRASVAMLQASKAYALLQGRDFVTPEDIKFVAPYVLQHRLILTAEAEMEGYSPVKVTQRLIDKVEVPK